MANEEKIPVFGPGNRNNGSSAIGGGHAHESLKVGRKAKGLDGGKGVGPIKSPVSPINPGKPIVNPGKPIVNPGKPIVNPGKPIVNPVAPKKP